MTISPFATFFDSAHPEASRLGGKGAGLCRLVQYGYRVPPGFVIPIEAFLHTCNVLGLKDELAAVSAALAGTGDVVRIGEQVQARLREGHLSPAVLTPILAAVDQLSLWRNNPHGVVVRSSATVEDSAAHSFAGIFESIPITTPELLEPTIREVWASVFSPRALTYCREVGLREFPRMAVVVQRFIEAERSGVMFTRFAGRTLVEHVEGGCEKLVKGEVTPEQLWMPGPGDAPEDPGPMAVEHAWELSRLAASLEQRFGAPQDVEWVLYQGAVHVVQSRPITTSVARAGAGETIDPTDAKPVLTGIPASGGWGSGPVHLVFNIENALALESGQVLVTPMTNPDMVVAMRKSAAIVTDVGGMICHAAIVSRELGLPCVVGTATATTTLAADEVITVVGTTGRVYRGRLESTRQVSPRPGEWSDIWSVWTRVTTDRPDLVPMVSSADALDALPASIKTVVLIPDVDLRCDETGLWRDLEGMTAGEADGTLRDYFSRVARVAREKSVERLYVQPNSPSLTALIDDVVRQIGRPLLDSTDRMPDGWTARLGSAALLGVAPAVPPLPGMESAEAAALDTLKFFGHVPGSSRAPMPSAERRSTWWALLPEYEKFHQEFRTQDESGEHTWLEVRPELVISALLKSLVQPGFEMVPRVMGFPALPPMHIKWIKCRYHFRSDTFAEVWQAIVRGTWDAGFMADLLRRTRISYQRLGEVALQFPTTDAELAATAPERMVALITAWWPRWVEFFALCWFQQAQGDDIVYPFIEETVGDHLKRLAGRRSDFAWPDAADLVAPTTPVMSGDYMASVGRLRQSLLAAGLTTRDAALAALDRREHPELSAQLAQHLAQWHWMRDRDLLFEPWDKPARVIETALRTDPHAPADYQANLQRNRLALSVHFDLAHGSGRAEGLNHAARFLHDLNAERENHHVLWLKYSYPLRRLVVEIERRLIAAGSLAPGDIFFLQAPELIEATRRLPAPLPPDLVNTVKNRRLGYLHEARLAEVDPEVLVREDDYY